MQLSKLILFSFHEKFEMRISFFDPGFWRGRCSGKRGRLKLLLQIPMRRAAALFGAAGRFEEKQDGDFEQGARDNGGSLLCNLRPGRRPRVDDGGSRGDTRRRGALNKMGFRNGPRGVKPLVSTSPMLGARRERASQCAVASAALIGCFRCLRRRSLASVRGRRDRRHIMPSEETVSLSNYAWSVG